MITIQIFNDLNWSYHNLSSIMIILTLQTFKFSFKILIHIINIILNLCILLYNI